MTELLEHAQTENEKAVIQAYIEENHSSDKAAKKLGKDGGNVRQVIRRVKARAAKINPELHNKKAPEGYMLGGVSTLTKNAAGENMWVKTRPDIQAQQEFIKEYASAFCTDIDPIPEIPKPKNKKLDTDIIPWFQIGDAHIGMLAHEAEVGHNFDLKIAERELIKAMQILIDRAPQCERCVIQDLGDSTHYENFSATTEASGHALDADGRFPKMIHVAARIMRSMIDYALKKFKFVDVIINQGNHSRTNDIWMAIFLRHVYEKNPRLHVLNNSSVFIPYRMGNTFVLCHHTDKCKPAKMAEVMATDFRQDFGEAEYKYLDGGHIHTRVVASEMRGCVYESWNQLAPSDKYAHDHGWRSRSCLTVVYRSRTYGEQRRDLLPIAEVKDLLDNLPAGTSAQKRRKVYTV